MTNSTLLVYGLKVCMRNCYGSQFRASSQPRTSPKPKSDMMERLSFLRSHDPSPIPRLLVQRALSWFWLSYDDPIIFPCPSHDSLRLESGLDSILEEVLGKKWQESKIKWKFKVVVSVHSLLSQTCSAISTMNLSLPTPRAHRPDKACVYTPLAKED